MRPYLNPVLTESEAWNCVTFRAEYFGKTTVQRWKFAQESEYQPSSFRFGSENWDLRTTTSENVPFNRVFKVKHSLIQKSRLRKRRCEKLEIWNTGSAEIRIIWKSANLKSIRNRSQVRKKKQRSLLSCFRASSWRLNQSRSKVAPKPKFPASLGGKNGWAVPNWNRRS